MDCQLVCCGNNQKNIFSVNPKERPSMSTYKKVPFPCLKCIGHNSASNQMFYRPIKMYWACSASNHIFYRPIKMYWTCASNHIFYRPVKMNWEYDASNHIVL